MAAAHLCALLVRLARIVELATRVGESVARLAARALASSRSSSYAASKGGLVALTRQLAAELAVDRVRVNAVAPGLFEVPRYFDLPGYTTELGDEMVPIGRIGQPRDVAWMVQTLASQRADFITGQVIYVDGGTHASMALDWLPGAAHDD